MFDFIEDEIDFSIVIDEKSFNENPLGCVEKFKALYVGYPLLVRHGYEEYMVHWTDKENVLNIRVNGLIPSSDGSDLDFGRGIYCFRQTCPNAKFGDAPIYFVTNDIWYECVACSFSETPIRYCFIPNRVGVRQLETKPREKPVSPLDYLYRMGYDISEIKSKYPVATKFKELHPLIQAINEGEDANPDLRNRILQIASNLRYYDTDIVMINPFKFKLRIETTLHTITLKSFEYAEREIIRQIDEVKLCD